MVEKRFTPSGRWIKDNYIDKLRNIDFNTITDRNLCCDLLNQLEDEKKMNGKIATKYFEENEQLKKNRFICLDCEHSGYTEIGCLCEKKDCWIDYKIECEDYEELE